MKARLGAREKPAAAFSISKTVTSLLLARAVAGGKPASLDDAIRVARQMQDPAR